MPNNAATVTPSSANASVVAKEESSSGSDNIEGVSIPSPMRLISCQGSEVFIPVSANNRQASATNSKLSDSF